jgi:hypothetical protein
LARIAKGSPKERLEWNEPGQKTVQMTELTSMERRYRDGPQGNRRGQREVMAWVHDRVRQLPFRLGRRAPELPLGTRVLVLKGEAHNDLGQMAVVSAMVGSCVEISYRDPLGTIKTRRKHRASLIRMDEGVELVVNEEGWPVLQARLDLERTESGEERGIVSSEDESRAQ